MSPTDAIDDRPSAGQLANNAMMVGMLQSALSQLDMGLGTLPDLLIAIDADHCWRAFKFPDSPTVHTHNAADFRVFIESERPAGCETPIGVLRRSVEGTEAAEIFERLIRGNPGGPNNPDGLGGKSHKSIVNRDDITVDNLADELHAEKPRDYRREAPTGTSVSYALRRLGKHRPDLLEKVRAGELSAHGAMVEAGFICKAITIPADAVVAGRRLARHFTREQFSELVSAALDVYEPRPP
jgi:hypothetical protein